MEVEDSSKGTVTDLSRRTRIGLAVALTPLWIALAAALFDLMCVLTGTPPDHAPTGFVVVAVTPTAVGIAVLATLVIMRFRRWQLFVALVCSLLVIPFLGFQLWSNSIAEMQLGYGFLLAAAALVFWLAAWNLQRTGS